jgi:glycine oxidase
VELARPVRLLHPRHSLYVVPWGGGTYMLGATSIESDDSGPVSVKSALDLLGMAYALHPAFGEARVISLDAGVRPSFPSNLPRIVLERDVIRVNGMYRHGFLLAPVLAEMVAAHLRGLPVDRSLFAARAADCMA